MVRHIHFKGAFLQVEYDEIKPDPETGFLGDYEIQSIELMGSREIYDLMDQCGQLEKIKENLND